MKLTKQWHYAVTAIGIFVVYSLIFNLMDLGPVINFILTSAMLVGMIVVIVKWVGFAKALKEQKDVPKSTSPSVSRDKKPKSIVKLTLISILAVSVFFLAIVFYGSNYDKSSPSTSTLRLFYGDAIVICKKSYVDCSKSFLGNCPDTPPTTTCKLDTKVLDSKVSFYLITMAVIDLFILVVGFFALYSRNQSAQRE